MAECDVAISTVYRLLNNTVLYQEWMKDCVNSDDIIDIGVDTQSTELDEDDPIQNQQSALIELYFELDPLVKLVLLRKSTVYTDKVKRFVITLENAKSEYRASKPKDIEVKITIKGERMSSSRTKIETSFCVTSKSSMLSGNVCDSLMNSIAESLSNIPLF
jgi:hypothetical protein